MHEFRGKVRSFAAVHQSINGKERRWVMGEVGHDVEDWLFCIRFAFLSGDLVLGGT
jgi:hypothetical protein